MNVQSQLSLNRLPQFYYENKLTIMLKDPSCLFAYWELDAGSEDAFIEQFGRNLWDKSVPVLKIVNLTYNCSFFINIIDTANSWYINVHKPGSTYVAEIGRKLYGDFFIAMASSNCVKIPPNSESKNTAAYFADYRMLKDGKTPTGTEIKCTTSLEQEHFLCEYIGESSITGKPRFKPAENLYGLSSSELQDHCTFNQQSAYTGKQHY